MMYDLNIACDVIVSEHRCYNMAFTPSCNVDIQAIMRSGIVLATTKV